MDMAALIAWIITALGGSYLLITWLIRGGMRQQKTGATNFPATLILGHFLIAASGLLTWTAYLLTDITALAWTALTGLLLVIVLGLTMFFRWGGENEKAGGAARASAPAVSGDAAAQQDRAPSAVPRRGASLGLGAAPGMRSSAATTKTPPPEPEHAAESHFPIAVVAGHGAFAVSTLVIVVLATLGVGS